MADIAHVEAWAVAGWADAVEIYTDEHGYGGEEPQERVAIYQRRLRVQWPTWLAPPVVALLERRAAVWPDRVYPVG